jgi:hypothetical protein
MNLSSRKDLATLLGVTVDQVRRNEQLWGLDKTRRDLNPRCVRYQKSQTMAILRVKGWVGGCVE